MSSINITPEVLNPIRAIARTSGWTAESVTLFSAPHCGVKITSGPGGRGVPRKSYLIVADTPADAFRALAECLELI